MVPQDAAEGFLSSPLRTANNGAEVHALEVWILVRQHICLHIAECRLRLVVDAVVKGLDDVFLQFPVRRYAAFPNTATSHQCNR